MRQPARLVLHLLVLLVCSVDLSAQDTAMFRGGLARTGVYNAPGVPTFTRIKWKLQTGGRLISSPAVSNGVIYVGSADRKLYAVDLDTGTPQWQFETEAPVVSSPAVADGVVYFGSYDDNFYAVDATTGKLKWKFQTAGERRFAAPHLHGMRPSHEVMPDHWDFYLSSPAVWRGRVYFGSGDGHIYAIDVASGKLSWKFKTGNVVHASPTIADGMLFIGSWDSCFYALDAMTGTERWRFKTGADHDTYNQVGIQGTAAAVNGVVYFGCRDSNVYALDARTGRQKWVAHNNGAWVSASVAVRDGRVYYATGDGGQFRTLDADTGTPIGSPVDFAQFMIFGSPAIAGKMAYVGTFAGKLAAVDLATKKIAWEFQTDASRENSAKYTKADGTMNYRALVPVRFYDDQIVGMSRVYSMGAILASAVVVDGVVYVASTDGFLYALM